MQIPEIRTGNFTSAGTPVAVNLDIGFVPDVFEMIIEADTNPNKYTFYKADNITVKEAGSAGTLTYETTNPITVYDASSVGTKTVMGQSGVVANTGGKGVTIPAALQVASKKVYWIAIRGATINP